MTADATQLTLFRTDSPSRRRLPHNRTRTSIAAAKVALAGAETGRAKVLAYVESCGNAGATQYEIAIATGLERPAVCGRCNDLVRAGLLIKTERERIPDGRRCAGAIYVRRAA